MTTTAAATYRMIGTTDDVLDCARCGKPDLRMTVVLAILDADGNEGDRTYYGTSCAARALADRGVRRTAAQVRDEAATAERVRRAAAREAAEWLTELGLPTVGTPSTAQYVAAVGVYAAANPRVARPLDALVEAVARRQSIIEAVAA